MKKILILLFLVFAVVDAKVQRLSSIPPAGVEFIDVEPGICDKACLQNLVNNKLEFSFLARYDAKYADGNLTNLYARLGGGGNALLLAQTIAQNQKDKVAVLIPENVIGGYSHVVSDAIFSYVISQNINAEVKFYLSGDESPSALRSALRQIKNDKISLVVAPLTVNGAKFIAQNSELEMLFFVPTLNYDMVGISRGNIFFGGIDYKDQIAKLLDVANSKIALFSDGSGLGNTLNFYVESLGGEIFAKNVINNAQTTILGMVDDSYNDSAVFLNLPLNKTALVTNQIALDKITPTALLSTQINYAPKLLTSIKFSDRKNLFIANSITNIPKDVANTAAIFGLDMSYNWVAYSTAIGLDYLYSTFKNPEHERIFSERVVGSSIIYNTKIYKTTQYGFIEVQ
ncbi:hypothetical protein [Campylobacter geochelonis]|uniref:hypothetical protein n=1 Tax=Campylobacter geochelonis TaxID=1780362 RepID=UPI000770B01E|nr:hypothetical protein [Campylobacter geochelonis]CZE48752.1 Putative periplasmic protein [Campylobacter geochelonis]